MSEKPDAKVRPEAWKISTNFEHEAAVGLANSETQTPYGTDGRLRTTMSFRRYGPEATYGIGGGGIVSEESQRNLDTAADLGRQGKQDEARPFLTMALKDINNVDAQIQLAYLCRPSLAVKLLESAERTDCFVDGGPCVGRFCDAALLPTRPYMRVLQALVRLSFETKQYGKGVRTAIEMLRLCPVSQKSVLADNWVHGLISLDKSLPTTEPCAEGYYSSLPPLSSLYSDSHRNTGYVYFTEVPIQKM
ncbi:hypothetical protein C8R45DRAFT_1192077 [Mycena sanguinolenta]|nr:hypothetical protein C8R45DRAFT_1192077 [Mycena sanguinolenta]